MATMSPIRQKNQINPSYEPRQRKDMSMDYSQNQYYGARKEEGRERRERPVRCNQENVSFENTKVNINLDDEDKLISKVLAREDRNKYLAETNKYPSHSKATRYRQEDSLSQTSNIPTDTLKFTPLMPENPNISNMRPETRPAPYREISEK